MELSAKERVLLAFQHKEADAVPIYGEARNIGFIERLSGRRLAGTTEEMEIITADAYAKAGIVLMRTLKTPYWGIVRGEDHDVRWDGYLSWKVGGERVYTYDEALEHVKVHWCGRDMDGRDAAVQRIREVNRIQAMLGERILYMPMVSASCLESIYHGIGIENFALMMYLEPDVLDEALEANMRHTVAVVEVMHEIYDGPIIHCCDDLGMKDRTIVSPAWLRAHVVPRMKMVADTIKAGGKFFSFHSCGNVTAVIPDLIAAGVEALNPLEITSGMVLKDVKAQYGDKLVLIGNADANIVQMGTPEDVRREVRRCLDEGAPGGGYFLNGGITQATPVENLVAYLDEAARYQGYRT